MLIRCRIYSRREFCARLVVCLSTTWLVAAAVSAQSLADLSLEELANIEITSVSRRTEKLSEAPSAVYVITRDDILRSGVTSIPEALRLAPGVEVARDDAHTWSITMRGFNSDLANKLLVLIDGRSVYSPLYAGVFWDAQDLLLEDVERIEVIAGPGGTMWGANAVNGVINIITRNAADTRGGYMEAGAGNEENAFVGARYGTTVGPDIHIRAHLKYFDRDDSRTAGNVDAVDGWEVVRGGFRADWKPAQADELTLQGNAYGGAEDVEVRDDFTLGTLPGPSFEDDSEFSGASLRGRWGRKLNEKSDFNLQLYYDYTRRNIPNTFGETRHTVDVDFQHHYMLGNRNNIVWGAAFRNTRDKLDNTLFASFLPERRSDQTWSFFVQDEIDVWRSRLYLTLGSKFEHNDYTGFEVQPSAQLTWLPTDRQTIWASVSRAVRIPSRLDTDLVLTAPIDIGIGLPFYVNVTGSDQFKSEIVIATEAGYRFQPHDLVTFDISAFYNDYEKLQTQEREKFEVVVQPPLVYAILPIAINNGLRGETYGSTIAATLQPASNWRIQASYTWLDIQLHPLPFSNDSDREGLEDNSPENQAAIHSYLDLPLNFSLYTGVRFVDNLSGLDVKSYVSTDMSLMWKPVEHLAISFTARDFNHKTHVEFGPDKLVQQSFYAKISWEF